MNNPLKDYLIKRKESPRAFAIRSGISPTTIYKVVHGEKCRLDVAKKIVRCTKKEILLKDFGYE